jgi:aryl-alcohol dehydrogenase-like predicted oxidoreductase
MTTLVESGKIRYIGISNYAAWQIANIMALCDKRNYVSPSITQNVYNLITRGIEVELIPFLDTQNIALTIYNPIAGGLLSGKYDFQKGPQDHTLFATNRMYLNRFWLKENFIAIKKLTEIAESYGISMLQLAYKWCIQNRAVASTISGVSNLSQLKQNISILEGGPLDQEIITACDEVWCSLPNNRFDYILK